MSRVLMLLCIAVPSLLPSLPEGEGRGGAIATAFYRCTNENFVVCVRCRSYGVSSVWSVRYGNHVRSSFLDCVSECAKNVIKGNVPLTARQKEKLRRSRKDLRALSVKKTALRRKRRILQKGGFLGALLPLLGVLSSLLLK